MPDPTVAATLAAFFFTFTLGAGFARAMTRAALRALERRS